MFWMFIDFIYIVVQITKISKPFPNNISIDFVIFVYDSLKKLEL